MILFGWFRFHKNWYSNIGFLIFFIGIFHGDFSKKV